MLKVTNTESSDSQRVAWTTTPADYDIGANDPIKGAQPGLAMPSEGRPCRRIIVFGAGVLQYNGLDGVTVTTPSLPAGTVLDIQAIKLLAGGSTATNVMVFW